MLHLFLHIIPLTIGIFGIHLKCSILKQVLTFRNCSAVRLLLRVYDDVGGRHCLGHQLCESWTGIAIEEGSLTQWQSPLPSRAEVIWGVHLRTLPGLWRSEWECPPMAHSFEYFPPIVCVIWGHLGHLWCWLGNCITKGRLWGAIPSSRSVLGLQFEVWTLSFCSQDSVPITCWLSSSNMDPNPLEL